MLTIPPTSQLHRYTHSAIYSFTDITENIPRLSTLYCLPSRFCCLVLLSSTYAYFTDSVLVPFGLWCLDFNRIDTVFIQTCIVIQLFKQVAVLAFCLSLFFLRLIPSSSLLSSTPSLHPSLPFHHLNKHELPDTVLGPRETMQKKINKFLPAWSFTFESSEGGKYKSNI